MMKDYEYLFVTLLHQKLKDQIVGRVYVTITPKNELFVEIISFGDLKWNMYFGRFSERILNGWSTDYAAYEIIKEFKGFIMSRYFK